MKENWKDVETYYEIIGDIPTNRNKTSFGIEVSDYTDLGEALSRFDEIVSYGGQCATLFKCTNFDTMDEPRCEIVKQWRNKEWK